VDCALVGGAEIANSAIASIVASDIFAFLKVLPPAIAIEK
jgi:hypothetical protein